MVWATSVERAVNEVTPDAYSNGSDVLPKTGAEVERFKGSLLQAMALHSWSQRELCERLGITIGTMTKYLKGMVEPFKVGLGIQTCLAKELGITLDALVAYYRTGEYETSVTLNDVESWIRSSAGQEDMPALMKSLHEASLRSLGVVENAGKIEPYTWPIEELNRAEVSDGMRERLGLTDAALRALATKGEFEDELVEAFALVTGYKADDVRRAFASRKPVV